MLRALALTFLFCHFSHATVSLPPTPPDSYWLWAGVPLSRLPAGRPLLYLHQGALRSERGTVRIVREGLAPFPIETGPLILVFRLGALSYASQLIATYVDLAGRWEKNGARVRGIQLDFDAPTAHLDGYRAWLRAFRAQLPRRYELSVTGLADWATTAKPSELSSLAGVPQEIVFQLYRGKRPIPGLKPYLRELARVRFPFRTGTLAGMSLPREILRNPFYRGNVVFLLKSGSTTR